MKAILSIPADQIFLAFARLSATLFKTRQSRETSETDRYGHVILAPSTRGNLGDEAMLTASIGEVRRRAKCSVTLLTHSSSDDWGDIARGVRQVSIEGYFSATNFPRAVWTLLRVLSGARSLSILGADVMDGAYSRSRSLRRICMLELAAALGVRSRVLGFSYSDRHNPSTHQYFIRISKHATLYPRDTKSYERLKESFQANVIGAADTAFLLEKASQPTPTAAEALKFITRKRKAGDKVIAFNANPLGASMSAGANSASSRIDNLETLVGNHLRAILDDQPLCSLVLIPHDPREPHNDRRLLQRAYNTLPADYRARVFCAFDAITARDVKLLCFHVDFALTGRMHMGIAALGAGCPTAFLDFQGKVRGLLERFGIPDLVFDWDVYKCTDRFVLFIREKLDQADVYRAKVDAAHESMVSLAKRNFDEFEEGAS